MEELRENYVLYFDIQGFKNLMKNTDMDIHKLVEEIKDIYRTCHNEAVLSDPNHFYIKCFSDNYIVVFNNEDIYSSLLNLILYASTIQMLFMSKYGLLIRGSIVKGEIFIDEKFVYGKALIDAYTIENRTFYPRIEVDEDIYKYLSQKNINAIEIDEYNNYSSTICKPLYFVNQFYCEDCILGDYKDRVLDDYRKKLIHNIEKYCNYEDTNINISETQKIIDKYIWILEKYNNHHNEKISYQLKLDRNIYKMYLEL